MSIREQLNAIDAAIAYRKTKIIDHQHEIRRLEYRRKELYRDSGMLPLAMLTGEEREKVVRLPAISEPCEYCGKQAVRRGKLLVCTECSHVNSPV